MRSPSSPRRCEEGFDGAAGRPGRGGAGGGAVLQQPQAVDLRRLQRDPEEHHLQDDPRALIAETRDELRTHRRPPHAGGHARAASSREQYGFEARDRIAQSPQGYSAEMWQQFAELGVIGALFGEADGGFGGSGFDIAVVFEALGRGLVVEPFLGAR